MKYLFLIAGIVFTICSSGCNNDKSSNMNSANTVSLNGAGATFPQPLYQRWFDEYKIKTGIEINYQAIGSGGGVKDITVHSVDFGASDVPLSDEEMAKAPGLMHIPTVAGAVVLCYNLPGTPNSIKLNGDIIADIYLGNIKTWDNPRIKSLNPNIIFPKINIVTYHRADGSGSTNIFTSYLSQVSTSWKQQIGSGKSVRWIGGVGGRGNPGISAFIKQTSGSIGYVELAYAHKYNMQYALVQNRAGNYIKPSVQSTIEAVAGIDTPDDLRMIVTNTSAPNGYPISGITYILVYKDSKPEIKQFLKWALTDGQKAAPELDYAPLPPAILRKAIDHVNSMKT